MPKLNKKLIIPIVTVVLILAVGGTILFARNDDQDTKEATTKETTQTTANDSVASQPPALSTTEDKLLYLIEEEKLAHDVYTVMYQKYGANVFGNILKSESTHQSRVLSLLNSRNIADPRSSEIGVFKNQDLQALYDQLIEQGSKSATEAYKVGVAIEEKDIADISDQLATATDEDVITTLEALRKGSENHLRAFNRQLN